jgi:hypothetical protein
VDISRRDGSVARWRLPHSLRRPRVQSAANHWLGQYFCGPRGIAGASRHSRPPPRPGKVFSIAIIRGRAGHASLGPQCARTLAAGRRHGIDAHRFLAWCLLRRVDLYRHEALDSSILTDMAKAAAANDAILVDRSLEAYGQLQGDKVVNVAARAHIIEFGLLAMLLAFFQPYVSSRETWKFRWAYVLILGSILLPVCVLMELRYGLVAGGLADIGGLLVIIALLAMWIGILRYTGQLDAQTGDVR